MRYWEGSHSRHRKGKPKRKGKSFLVSGGNLRKTPFLRKFYQHQAEISDELQKFIFFVIIAVFLYAFILGDGGVIRILMMKHKKAELDGKITKLKESVALLEREIDRLKNDPFYMEKIGREKYGYIYPGEKVYKIIPIVEKKEKLER